MCDVSFISATLIVPKIGRFSSPHGRMIILVKPQFEVGREEVGKGGIVRDPELHRAACDRVRALVARRSVLPLPCSKAPSSGQKAIANFYFTQGRSKLPRK